MNLHQTLTSIRAFAPDLEAILAHTGPLPESIHPVLHDYLDAHVRSWKRRARFVIAHCKNCNTQTARPVRLTTTYDEQPAQNLVQQGSGIWRRHIDGHCVGWMQPELDDLYIHPWDMLWADCEDYGCCGASGTRHNTRCRCGHPVGTTHTDCCGPHFFGLSTQQVELRWGLPELSPQEQRLLEQLRSLSPTHAGEFVRELPLPLTPALDAAVLELLGPFGQLCFERLCDGYTLGWHTNWENNGRQTTYDSDHTPRHTALYRNSIEQQT